MLDTIKYPFGPADLKTVADDAVIEVAVTNPMTIVNVDQLAAAATINLTVDSEMPIGAQLFIRLQSDGTARDVTPGTGMEGNVIAGTISKTKIASFIYDGTSYVHTGTQQID